LDLFYDSKHVCLKCNYVMKLLCLSGICILYRLNYYLFETRYHFPQWFTPFRYILEKQYTYSFENIYSTRELMCLILLARNPTPAQHNKPKTGVSHGLNRVVASKKDEMHIILIVFRWNKNSYIFVTVLRNGSLEGLCVFQSVKSYSC
jgi:hypothetical protein